MTGRGPRKGVSEDKPPQGPHCACDAPAGSRDSLPSCPTQLVPTPQLCVPGPRMLLEVSSEPAVRRLVPRSSWGSSYSGSSPGCSQEAKWGRQSWAGHWIKATVTLGLHGDTSPSFSSSLSTPRPPVVSSLPLHSYPIGKECTREQFIFLSL